MRLAVHHAFVMGLAIMRDPHAFQTARGPVFPPEMAFMLAVMGGAMVLASWIIGVLIIYAGKCINQRKGYTFIFVMACVQCLHMPIGTALGVFTLIVMTRPSVKAVFGQYVGPPPGYEVHQSREVE